MAEEKGTNRKRVPIVRIITKQAIRYEGEKPVVDKENKTITLRRVRIFGTDDRETAVQIPEFEAVYECVMFRSENIRDLKVLGEKTEKVLEKKILRTEASFGDLENSDGIGDSQEQNLGAENENMQFFSEQTENFENNELKILKNRIAGKAKYQTQEFFDDLTSSTSNKGRGNDPFYLETETNNNTFGVKVPDTIEKITDEISEIEPEKVAKKSEERSVSSEKEAKVVTVERENSRPKRRENQRGGYRNGRRERKRKTGMRRNHERGRRQNYYEDSRSRERYRYDKRRW